MADRSTRMPMTLTDPRAPGNPVIYVNEAFQALTGYAPAEVVGRNCRFLQGPETDPETVRQLRRAVEAGEPVEVEIRNYRKDGTAFWNRLLIAPVRDASGDVRFFFASQRDVTAERDSQARQSRDRGEAARARLRAAAAERRRADEALWQSHKMEAIGQLTGGIAHDFNNMLQAIGGSLELMDRRLGQGRAADAALLAGKARDTVKRAAALTHQLLAFARRQTLQPRPVVLDSLIESMSELIRRAVGPGIDVSFEAGDGKWPVLCDPGQLESALVNLSMNARDAMPEGGTLKLATADVELAETDVAGQEGALPGAYVEVAVTDTGTGMDEATRARAFDPFFTTKPLGQGTGLGLSQTYGFVRQSRGVIRLESAEAKGTTVRLYLPRHEQTDGSGQPAADAPAAAPAALARPPVVLLVEDEEVGRHLAAERLCEMGCVVREAEDGAAALRILRAAGRIDVLVTDVGLRGAMNGRQVADAARELRPALPVLFITGYAGAALSDVLAPGMLVIRKPFPLDTLATRVRDMLPPQNP